MITTRIASIDDIESCVELLLQLFSNELEFTPDAEKQRRGLRVILENRSVGEIMLVEVDGVVCGMVSLLYTISTALGGKAALLEDMVIDRNHRKQGLGTMLLTAAIAHAKKTDCMRITLLTDNNNTIAQNFYLSNGFNHSAMIAMRQLL